MDTTDEVVIFETFPFRSRNDRPSATTRKMALGSSLKLRHNIYDFNVTTCVCNSHSSKTRAVYLYHVVVSYPYEETISYILKAKPDYFLYAFLLSDR